MYVKDESPPKKKSTTTVAVATTANSDVEKHQHNKAGATLTAATDGLNSLVQAAGIQIVSDADGTRVQQYKCAMQVSVNLQHAFTWSAENHDSLASKETEYVLGRKNYLAIIV